MRHVTIPLVALVLVAPALAGCLEGSGGPGSGAVITEDTRYLDHGQLSRAEGLAEHVFTDADAWTAFWREHEDDANATPPDVDFSEERVLAVVLGDRPNGCYLVAIGNVTTDTGAGVTTAEVTEFTPPPDQACIEMITRPFHFTAIPDRDTDVEFEHEARPPGPGDEPPGPD